MLTLPTTPQTRAAPRAATLRRHALELGGWTHTLAWASESAAAFALLVLATPLILGLAAFVLLVDGRPAFYRGERLGRGKKPFTMIKIRTLRRGAERVTVDRLLESRDGLEIPGGRWLRESRLDELPQLWNVVCGDMRFIGPRPERRGVYLAHCRTLPRYAQRFAVAPGLIGPSQLFTPHATHKRIRCCLDNAWCRRRRSASELLGLTAYTVLAVVRKVGERAAETLGECWRTRLLARRPQQRRQRRVRPQGAYVTLGLSGGPGTGVHALLVDLSDETLRVQSGAAFAVGAQLSIRLTLCLGVSWAHRCALRASRPWSWRGACAGTAAS